MLSCEFVVARKVWSTSRPKLTVKPPRREAASLHPAGSDDVALYRALDGIAIHGGVAAALYTTMIPANSAPPLAVAAAYGAFLLDVANEPMLVSA